MGPFSPICRAERNWMLGSCFLFPLNLLQYWNGSGGKFFLEWWSNKSLARKPAWTMKLTNHWHQISCVVVSQPTKRHQLYCRKTTDKNYSKLNELIEQCRKGTLGFYLKICRYCWVTWHVVVMYSKRCDLMVAHISSTKECRCDHGAASP